jgi:hypothetical protein
MYSAEAQPTFLGCGFPIRRSTGRCLLTAHRRLSQFCHVLHRLLVPRHPPNALTSLTTITFCPSSDFSAEALRQAVKSMSLFAFVSAVFPRNRDPRRYTRLFTFRTSFNYSVFRSRDPVGGPAVSQARFELATPRLSSVCSNQLSYWPVAIGPSRPNSGDGR